MCLVTFLLGGTIMKRSILLVTVAAFALTSGPLFAEGLKKGPQ